MPQIENNNKDTGTGADAIPLNDGGRIQKEIVPTLALNTNDLVLETRRATGEGLFICKITYNGDFLVVDIGRMQLEVRAGEVRPLGKSAGYDPSYHHKETQARLDGRHCVVKFDGSNLTVVDPNSKNGTFASYVQKDAPKPEENTSSTVVQEQVTVLEQVVKDLLNGKGVF